MAAVAAVAATAAYIRRLRAELAAAKRDNDEFVAAALRDKLEQQQPPPQQAPPAPVASAPAPRPPKHPTTAIDGRAVAGYMFVCTSKTQDDVDKFSLVGAPSTELGTLQQLFSNLPRAPLFLYNFKSRRLRGPLNARAVGYALERTAFEGKFKAHVRFTSSDVTTTIVWSGTSRL